MYWFKKKKKKKSSSGENKPKIDFEGKSNNQVYVKSQGPEKKIHH